ncbi:MAG: insulinase family protein [Oscillospiraceae bacterium]|nr:insulinase family protein [Oscillospiraceae bacterium]
MEITQLASGVTLRFIQNNRFKTTMISICFYLPLNKNTVSVEALIPKVMTAQSPKYKDFSEINRRLDSLYGAVLSTNVDKLGDLHEIRFAVSALSDRYTLENSGALSGVTELLSELLFSQYLSGQKYEDSVLTREKRLLTEEINSEINDKRRYARQRCEQEMCSGEPYGLPAHGTIEGVKAIDDDCLYKQIEMMLKTAYVNIQITGEKLPAGILETFKQSFSKIQRDYQTLNKDIINPAETLETIVEKMDVKQGKLVMGLRSASVGNDEQTISTMVMGDLFGGGPYSKLFCNVREKLSLCYYCSARSVRRKGLIFVESGVEKQNTERAKEEIINQFNAVKSGDFTAENLAESTRSLSDSVKSVSDDLSSLDRWYSTRTFEENPLSPEGFAKKISLVTADDVKESANRFLLDTVYIIEPKEELENE